MTNKNIRLQTVLCGAFSLCGAFGAWASATKENKFSFDGLAKAHPVTMELESVAYSSKSVDLKFKIVNNSDVGVDFSRANFKISTTQQSGFIEASQFDGLTVQPKSKRFAEITFGFDDTLKPSFREERSKGTMTVNIENVVNFKNQKLAPIVLKNY